MSGISTVAGILGIIAIVGGWVFAAWKIVTPDGFTRRLEQTTNARSRYLRLADDLDAVGIDSTVARGLADRVVVNREFRQQAADADSVRPWVWFASLVTVAAFVAVAAVHKRPELSPFYSTVANYAFLVLALLVVAFAGIVPFLQFRFDRTVTKAVDSHIRARAAQAAADAVNQEGVGTRMHRAAREVGGFDDLSDDV